MAPGAAREKAAIPTPLELGVAIARVLYARGTAVVGETVDVDSITLEADGAHLAVWVSIADGEWVERRFSKVDILEAI